LRNGLAFTISHGFDHGFGFGEFSPQQAALTFVALAGTTVQTIAAIAAAAIDGFRARTSA
jgi:hypothetical protein